MTPKKSKARLERSARKMEARIKKSDLRWKRRERAGKAAKA